MDNGNDRYDRYNSERKIPGSGNNYADTSRSQFSGPSQDRFGGSIGRSYDSRRY